MKRVHGYLTLNDRERIEQLWRDGATQKEIAQKLGVHYTTVYDELKRGENGLSYADHRMAYRVESEPMYFQNTGDLLCESGFLTLDADMNIQEALFDFADVNADDKKNEETAFRFVAAMCALEYGSGDYWLHDLHYQSGLTENETVLNEAMSVFVDSFDINDNTTIDANGSEFSDCEGIERSAIKKGEKRTKIYYCHPCSAYERGSNENQNGIIRRPFPKGTSFDKVTLAQVAEAEDWLNNYPRPLFGYRSANDVFDECLCSI